MNGGGGGAQEKSRGFGAESESSNRPFSRLMMRPRGGLAGYVVR